MLKHLTIRRRILLTFLSIVLTASMIQLIIAGRQLQLATLEFYQHHLETDALMISATLSEPLEHYLEGEGTSAMQRLLANLQREGDYDYLIVDDRYRVVGFTAEVGYESLDRVSQTPELAIAEQGQIGADIREGHDDTTHLYVAVAIQYEGESLGYLVLSRPIAPAYTEIYQQWLELGSTTLPVVAVVIIVGLWLSSTISRPVQALRNSALRMAEGELDTRIKSDSHDEIGQLATAFNYMAEKIEGLMKAQRSFVNNAAHELRTPLMTLKLRMEALQEDTLPDAERTKYTCEIQQEINHMAELVSSLLILARIDEGRYKRTGHTTDTTSLLSDIARHWRIEAKQAALDFETDIPMDLPDIDFTPNDLRLVLDNLLSNAIKYTHRGKVTFVVWQENETVILQVRDTGTGFNPDQVEQLFNRFYRSDEARANFEGNGLGLSIVQSIIEHYGANIVAESAGIGLGATFTVPLPVLAQA